MPRVKPKPEELTEAYIDESSQTNHRYIGFGVLVIHHTHVAELQRRIWAARLPELPRHEMGWTKVSASKLAAYKRVANVLFDRRLETQPMHFHLMVVDSWKLKDRIFNGGSREVGFNKEVYQICQKVRRLYRGRLFHIYLDKRTTARPLRELQSVLNFGAFKYGDNRDWPFRRVQFRDSAASVEIQLVDILLGAVMFRLNRHHAAAGASPAKKDLSAYILRKAGISDPLKDTDVSGRFTIWHRNLQ